MTKCTYETPMHLSVSKIEPGMNSDISNAMWQVSPEYKFQLVSCDLSSKYLLRLSALVDTRAVDLGC